MVKLLHSAPGQTSLVGTLNMDSCATLLSSLTDLAAAESLTIDLSAVEAADSAALALLLAVKRTAIAAGHTLMVKHWPTGLYGLLELYSMTPLFPASTGE
ncbi:STAS domain-containing protein [Neisseriaceae bacterium TC5R-5]|nr:STAS domain-containing protein [Neisseriaceae bacterium TC5R-5]